MKITEPAEPISRLSVAACPCGARRQAQQAINAAILALSLAVSPCILLAEGDLPPLHEDPADDAEKQPVPEDIHHEPAPELAQEAEATLSVEEERDRI
ncbi:MAG: hypothetical protein JW808_10765, partial [Victivallales bacterium]|nr:hypothetical protein [Victivallales bacterium]